MTSQATVNGARIVRGIVRIPNNGGLWADIEIESGAILTGPATIAIGAATYVGDFVPGRGGVSTNVGRYLVRGALAWDTIVRSAPYQSDAGVRLLTPLVDLAREIGQASKISLPPQRVLGTHWQRPAGQARDALSALVGAWFADASNVVQCSTRPPGAVVEPAARVLHRNMAQRMRTVGTERPEAFVPGLTLEGDTIDAVTISLQKAGYVLSVWGRP